MELDARILRAMKQAPISKLAEQLEARRAKRDAEILRLAQAGHSKAEIARRVGGVTRQRVQQILARLAG